tara:strand:+ start:1374 stop:2000 length:627 start_codon:yes stop_codon:yes gene_type:complete
MVQMHIPEQGDDLNLTNQYYDIAKAGTADVLGASFQETLYYNPMNALDRLSEQYLGKGTQGETISKETWAESEYYRAGIDVGDGGIKTGLAQLLADRVDKRNEFQITLQRSKGGLGLGAAQFGVAIAGSFLDPLNIASAFIPVVGPARMAVMASKLAYHLKTDLKLSSQPTLLFEVVIYLIGHLFCQSQRALPHLKHYQRLRLKNYLT